MRVIHSSANTHILLPDNSPLPVEENWFEPSYWQQQNKVVSEKKGRAKTYFLNLGEQIGVLRHYWRGGLVGKVLSDQYLFSRLENTRTYQEFQLLTQLEELGLPVSKPIAARVQRSGFIYRGDLITEAIAGAQSVLDKLKQAPLTKSEWLATAETLARFHNKGVFHADLNINNILFNEHGKVFLIDFDRGEVRKPSQQTVENNMARLKRSFIKELNRNTEFYWQESEWDEFYALYRSFLTI